MDFVTAVKTCFRKYFVFRGRARRSEFWFFVLFLVIASIVIGLLDRVIFGGSSPMNTSNVGISFGTQNGPLSAIFSLLTFIPLLSAGFRRLHDTGRSGWWLGGFFLSYLLWSVLVLVLFGIVGISSGVGILFALVGIIYLVWMIALLVFYCLDTKQGDNKYGADPKYAGVESAFD